MPEASWLQSATPAFRLMIATSWLAPASWQEKQEQAIREAIQAIGAGMDWMEYLRMVDRHRTPALSWAALMRVPGLQIPEPAKKELQKRGDACRMQAVRNSLKLAGVLKGFHSAAIPVMPMKGPILSLELYGDVGLRQSHDLDLMVKPQDLARAQACLESMGWRQDATWFPLSPRQWENLLRHEHDLLFVHPHGHGLLELHWRARWELRDQAEDRWARSIPAVWQGCLHKAMSPIDQVLYLCSHGGVHGWFRAKWLGDLARIHAEGRMDWQAALDQASRSGQERALLACLRLLQDVYGLPVPDLPGNPWRNLPSFLIARPLHDLKVPEDPAAFGALAMARNHFRLIRYERLAVPQKTGCDLLEELAYRREDFQVLRLPDSFYWAYAPLRPFLWVWRRLLRRGPASG
jgi:hypothetical protein